MICSLEGCPTQIFKALGWQDGPRVTPSNATSSATIGVLEPTSGATRRLYPDIPDFGTPSRASSTPPKTPPRTPSVPRRSINRTLPNAPRSEPTKLRSAFSPQSTPSKPQSKKVTSGPNPFQGLAPGILPYPHQIKAFEFMLKRESGPEKSFLLADVSYYSALE